MSAAPAGAPTPPTVPVWGPAVRLGYWALAASVAACLWLPEGGPWHERLGYAALALAALRTSAGWWARAPQLRFAGFVAGWRATAAYAAALPMPSRCRAGPRRCSTPCTASQAGPLPAWCRCRPTTSPAGRAALTIN